MLKAEEGELIEVQRAKLAILLHEPQFDRAVVCFGEQNVRSSTARSDKQIEEKAFLPSINVYQQRLKK